MPVGKQKLQYDVSVHNMLSFTALFFSSSIPLFPFYVFSHSPILYPTFLFDLISIKLGRPIKTKQFCLINFMHHASVFMYVMPLSIAEEAKSEHINIDVHMF